MIYVNMNKNIHMHTFSLNCPQFILEFEEVLVKITGLRPWNIDVNSALVDVEIAVDVNLIVVDVGVMLAVVDNDVDLKSSVVLVMSIGLELGIEDRADVEDIVDYLEQTFVNW